VTQAHFKENIMTEHAFGHHARALLEAEEIRALAAQFEAAWAEEGVIHNKADTTDDEANAATARVHEIARKIVALPVPDMATMRLKARVYLWSESTDFETFAAKNEGDGWSEAVLVNLFRDLGANSDAKVEAAATAVSKSHYSAAFFGLEDRIRDLANMAAVAEIRL
jgi:hypothetical protein